MNLMGGFGAAFAASGAATSQDQRTHFYTLWFYNLKNGTQPTRVHDFLKNGMLPALAKAEAGPALVMEAVFAPHMPQVAMLFGSPSFAELWNIHTKATQNPEFAKQMAEFEQGEEPPFETEQTMLLQAAPYAPELVADKEPRKTPRYFELRVYHSPTWRQLRALHERFAGPEVQIFHRSGIFPILYSSTLIGPNMPNLTYVIPFESLDAREKAWAKFGADPEWVKVRKESTDKYGQVASVIQISLYKAMPYSPIG